MPLLVRTTLRLRLFVALITGIALVAPAAAYTLWSTSATYLGSGEFHGPGANLQNAPLFPIVIRNIMFLNARDFVTPFENHGARQANLCGENQPADGLHGRLSDGSLINENIETCAAVIGGAKVFPAAINGGLYIGQQVSATLEDGNITMAMDLGIDLVPGGRGVVKLPYYGTTGEVTVPLSAQTQMGGHGIDRAGMYASGTRLRGRVGDFNHDGWIDGTIVATGVMPLNSTFYPGQPYVIVRHFETNIPAAGEWSSDVKALRRTAARGQTGGRAPGALR
jgi:hypothetical protein